MEREREAQLTDKQRVSCKAVQRVAYNAGEYLNNFERNGSKRREFSKEGLREAMRSKSKRFVFLFVLFVRRLKHDARTRRSYSA